MNVENVEMDNSLKCVLFIISQLELGPRVDCVGLAEDVANAYDMGINSEFRHYRFASATATFSILAWL